MCTSIEFMSSIFTSDLVATVGPTAWLDGVQIGSNTTQAVEASGLLRPGGAGIYDCNGWTPPATSGLVIQGPGRFSIAGCGTSLRVVCCAPAED
jgi:hypothetical protein